MGISSMHRFSWGKCTWPTNNGASCRGSTWEGRVGEVPAGFGSKGRRQKCSNSFSASTSHLWGRQSLSVSFSWGSRDVWAGKIRVSEAFLADFCYIGWNTYGKSLWDSSCLPLPQLTAQKGKLKSQELSGGYKYHRIHGESRSVRQNESWCSLSKPNTYIGYCRVGPEVKAN